MRIYIKYSTFVVLFCLLRLRSNYFDNHIIFRMKKIALLVFLCLAANIFAERIEPIPFGDMESWTVRYIKESKLLGGQIKTLYALAPTDTIWENGPYTYGLNGDRKSVV